MLTRYDYFYDGQIRRFLLQVVRAFSGFQYMTGQRGDIPPQLKVVPCTMAKRNRQVAAIQKNLSENVVNTVPMITVDMLNLQFDADRLQNPGHISRLQVYERKRDQVTGEYTSEHGNSITIERLMPRPFTMTLQIDIWTSNMHQKHQLMEQILEVIYPTFDIQNSDNPLDWSALTVAHPKDTQWSSVTVPVGNDEAIDIATITLEIPFWISPPAKVKRQRVIEQIITNINEADEYEGELLMGQRLAQEVTTPGNHYIRIDGSLIHLLGSKANSTNPEGEQYRWQDLFYEYDKVISPAQSQLRLRFEIEDGAPEIIGTLQATSNGSVLDWQIDVDTLPVNTMPAINAVIDPIRTVPGDHLPSASQGQRYLLANDLPASSQAWGTHGARIGAIIEYKDGEWVDVFSGLPNPQKQFVLNSASGRQLRWTGTEWRMAIDGLYAPGYWRII
jgi:hypothetical protein